MYISLDCDKNKTAFEKNLKSQKIKMSKLIIGQDGFQHWIT